MGQAKKQTLISMEQIQIIFGNIDLLVDFQRKFLIGLEDVALARPEDQHLGQLFLMHVCFKCSIPQPISSFF